MVDECTQDWTLLSAEAGTGSLVFEAERALDTGDTQDRVFKDDTQDGENRVFLWQSRVCCSIESTGVRSVRCRSMRFGKEQRLAVHGNGPCGQKTALVFLLVLHSVHWRPHSLAVHIKVV